MTTKNIKKITRFFVFSLLLIFVIIYRFEMMYYTSTALGYDKNKAEKYSFLFSYKTFEISKVKLRNIFNPKWQEEEKLEFALKAKKQFVKKNFEKINITDNKFFFSRRILRLSFVI